MTDYEVFRMFLGNLADRMSLLGYPNPFKSITLSQELFDHFHKELGFAGEPVENGTLETLLPQIVETTELSISRSTT